MFNIESRLEVIEEPSVGMTTEEGKYIKLDAAKYYRVTSSCGKLSYTDEYASHIYDKHAAELTNKDALIAILESVVKNNLTRLI